MKIKIDEIESIIDELNSIIKTCNCIVIKTNSIMDNRKIVEHFQKIYPNLKIVSISEILVDKILNKSILLDFTCPEILLIEDYDLIDLVDKSEFSKVIECFNKSKIIILTNIDSNTPDGCFKIEVEEDEEFIANLLTKLTSINRLCINEVFSEDIYVI